MATSAAAAAPSRSQNLPRSAQEMEAILQAMHVTSYDPMVLNQLIELQQRACIVFVSVCFFLDGFLRVWSWR